MGVAGGEASDSWHESSIDSRVRIGTPIHSK
jgi:hypothetical protein